MTFAADASASPAPPNTGLSRWKMHAYGLVVTVWWPLAVLAYHSDTPSAQHSPTDLIATTMMWVGLLFMGPCFIAPCLNQKRYRLLLYTMTIPLTFKTDGA
jgi:hypothetical protein